MGSCIKGYDISNANNNSLNFKLRYNITDGIDINQWEVKGNNGENLTLSLFDFAGQEIYYNTHQFFLCKDSLYLLMFNPTVPLFQNRIAHWIYTIMSKAPSATIFIIATHIDRLGQYQQYYEQTQMILSNLINNIQIHFTDEEKLKIISPSKKHLFWTLSTLKKRSPKNHFSLTFAQNQNQLLIKKIIQVAEEQIKEKKFSFVPRKWLEFRSILLPHLSNYQNENEIANYQIISKEKANNLVNQIQNHINQSQIPIINLKMMIEIATHFSIEKNELMLLLELLGSWGEIIFVKNNQNNNQNNNNNNNNNNENESKIILKPTWLISIFKFFISAKYLQPPSPSPINSSPSQTNININNNKINNNNSHIQTIKNIFANWKKIFNSDDEKSNEETNLIVKSVIDLLTELKLIIPLSENELLIPPILQANSSNSINSILQKLNNQINEQIIIIERIYELKFLPSGLFTQILTELWFQRKFSPNNMWRDGFIIGDVNSQSSAIIQFTNSDHQSISSTINVIIRCTHNFICDLLPMIHRTINNILKSISLKQGI